MLSPAQLGIVAAASQAAATIEDGEWQTAYDVANGGGTIGWGHYTFRVTLDASLFTSASTKIRIRLSGPTGTTTVVLDHVYVGIKAASGSAYDFASAPTELLWSGVSGVSLGINEHKWSDDLDFSLNGSQGVVVSGYFHQTPSSGATRVTLGGGMAGYYKAGSDATTVDASGYTTYGYGICVTGAEVFVT